MNNTFRLNFNVMYLLNCLLKYLVASTLKLVNIVSVISIGYYGGQLAYARLADYFKPLAQLTQIATVAVDGNRNRKF